MNKDLQYKDLAVVSAGCHINDVMNFQKRETLLAPVSAGCHINDVMNL